MPSEAWPQLLLYRRDLFAAAGLPEPRTYADVTAAATRLNTDDVAGFVGATIAGDAFTQQTFEHLALANGCEMVDEGGRVALDSPACVASFAFYDDLIRNHSVAGAQDVDTTRATYFAGKAAMMIWSSFILDELAGLRDDAAPSCPQCAADPRFLVDNTGIVTALTGPDGREPAQFGEVQSWAVLADANAGPAARFIEFMMSDGYLDCPGVGSGGQDSRRGRARRRSPRGSWTRGGRCRRASTGGCRWASCTRRRCSTSLAGSVDTFRRWGITQGQGALVGATLGELPVPQAIAAMTSGEIDPARGGAGGHRGRVRAAGLAAMTAPGRAWAGREDPGRERAGRTHSGRGRSAIRARSPSATPGSGSCCWRRRSWSWWPWSSSRSCGRSCSPSRTCG